MSPGSRDGHGKERMIELNAQEHYKEGLRLALQDVSKRDVDASIRHFEEALAMGLSDACYFLGRFFTLGDGIMKDEMRAYDYIRQGHQMKSAKATHALGVALRHGIGVEKQTEEADAFFDVAYPVLLDEARAGDAASMYLVGTSHYYGYGVKADLLKALEWFKHGADLGYSDAIYMLAMIMENHEGDQDQVLELYQKAARMGHAYALYALGAHMLEQKIWPKAVVYLEQAAKNHYVLAQYTLGIYYHDHESKKPMKAYRWFLEAAKQGHAQAAYHVGLYHQTGKGVSKDDQQALYWYDKAARQKEKNALYHLALMMIKQEEKDFKIIFKLLEQAAVQDHPHAQYNLGVMYQRGDGVEVNDHKAFLWYEKSAQAGLAKAQYNLGMLYYMGIGVDQSEEEAIKWWRSAAEQGQEDAQKLMLSIDNYGKLQNSPFKS